jgi:hypothetical protein
VAGTRRAAALVAVALVLGSATPASADPRLDHLCRNPAFANMHEHECVINTPSGGGGGRRGLFERIRDAIGGIL